jgi:hypothetical protein
MLSLALLLTLSFPDDQADPVKQAAVATYTGAYSDLPGVLLRRPTKAAGPDAWEKLSSGAAVGPTDTLMSVPGFVNRIQTPAVSLLLRGSVREFALGPLQQLLLESAVVLHDSKEVDLDLTLLRGRIFLTSKKDSGVVKVRLRFGPRESWDITLGERAQVGVDLARIFTPDTKPRSGEEPRTYLYLALIRGKATVQVERGVSYTRQAKPPQAFLYAWDGRRKATAPVEMSKLPPAWGKQPPASSDVSGTRMGQVKRMNAALVALQKRLDGKTSVAAAIREGLTLDDPMARTLAICCLGAIDDVGRLVDRMGDEKPAHAGDRITAVFVLRRWLNRGAGQTRVLFDEKTQTGVLLDRKYTPAQAKTICDLLYDLPINSWARAETFTMLARHARSPRVAIAELAYSHLLALARGVQLPAFNAASSLDARRKFADRIDDLVARKQLPPRPER